MDGEKILYITTQKEFFHKWSQRTGIPQNELRRLWFEAVDLFEEAANYRDESKVLLPGIGNIMTYPVEMRKSRNPKTGEILLAEATRRSHVRLLPSFKNKLK